MEEQYNDGEVTSDINESTTEQVDDKQLALSDEQTPTSSDADDDFYNADDSDAPAPEVIERKDDKATKKKFHEHIAEIQRIKYQALKENEALRAENERLSMLSNASAQTAMQHYEESANQRLQAAREFKQRAYDSGDIKEQIDADIALSMAVSEIQTLNQKKSEQIALQQPYYQTQQPPPHNPEFEARGWIERNPWFSQASDEYDDWMASEMNNYCNALDNDLYRRGMGSKIMSTEYFETLDNQARALAEYRNKGNRGDLNMQRAPNMVSPVRGGGNVGGHQSRPQQIKLSAAEKNIARKLGITDANYLQHKIEDMKEMKSNPQRR